ncbi:ATP-binding cassette domain-containing protein [Paenibacillus sacheonensis]|uniref:UvrABC system protein A n=1 Tax=Paenibacillus sacheonensis TaxID=742054 RepID=A0A7X4YN32_9BACL|nr:excinuclease ABC subunit UvrA [Paenibacillus sacheonensis]MBM7564879.1 excinuclease UvrABC ATPase subunit [Paenibacillus sacheonensis]NBC69427.1 ATP-binding cassette domain-containing protein [Paenibacillus sacheonensis]
MNESNQEYIVIAGARENNLKNVSLRIPKRKITIFTGVSGSGKSSIVFDTIAAESTRLLNENFSMFVRTFLPRVPQPDTDAIENLSMAVIVDQKRLGGGSHSTMGTITDISPILRLLFSRAGQPYVGPVNLFSFNDPQGMCPECSGIGRRLGVDMNRAVDMSKSLSEGAVMLPDYSVNGWEWNMIVQSGPFDPDKKLSDYPEAELEQLLYGKARKVEMDFAGKAVNVTVEGILEKFTNKYIKQDVKTKSERTQKTVAPFITEGPCSSCRGARLSQAALGCRINGRNIAELSAMEVGELIRVVREIDDPIAAPIVKSLTERLQHLVDIGLDYLTLDRETDTLSGGESQRVKMVKHLSGSLVDVTYIFDEPSIGLHPRDVHRLVGLLRKLRDKGNTVIVVEHDPDVIKVADHIVDVGPHAGSRGGTIVYEGSYQGLMEAGTLTGTHLKREIRLKQDCRQPSGKLPIKHATLHNLRNVSVDLPTGVLTVVTGVAGSGKSTLIGDVFLSQHSDAIVIDQSAIGVSTRSNPATYTGIMDDVRKAFASANKVNQGLFSFNSKGACENCQGLGVVYTDLAFLESVKLPCEACGGRRFKEEVLAYKLDGRSIADVLEMTVEQALDFFQLKEVVRKLQAMSDVGLNYITLGQPLSTLSGGECQRIKLASELHKKGSIYVMDEPTTGLHMSDIGHLLAIMNRLVDAGNTVIVIEHNLEVISQADWIIDMGPDGGSKGGQLVFEGTPAQIVHAEHSITGHYLA